MELPSHARNMVHVSCPGSKDVKTLASGHFQEFPRQITRSHMDLHTCNYGAESGRELFKGSKDAASLLVCTRKKNFGLGNVDFLWVTS